MNQPSEPTQSQRPLIAREQQDGKSETSTVRLRESKPPTHSLADRVQRRRATRRAFTAAALFVCTLGMGSLRADEEFDAMWPVAEQIMGEVLAHHPHPPTRQQMLASGFGNLSGNDEAYSSWVRKFSDADPSELRAVALELWEPLPATIQATDGLGNRVEATRTELFLRGLVSSIVGEAELVAAKDAAVNRQLRENRYVGIGVKLKVVDGVTTLVEPIMLGSAWSAGLKAEDQFVSVDGQDVVGWTIEEVVQILRGPIDTSVRVGIHRAEAEPFEVELKRTEVPIATVLGTSRTDDGAWSVALESAPEIAWLSLQSVAGSTPAELRALLRKAREENCQVVVIDGRMCVEAEAHQCVLLADLLLGQASLGQASGNSGSQELVSTGDGEWLEKPIVFVTSSGTADELMWAMRCVRQREDVRILGVNAIYRPYERRDVELTDGSVLERLPVARLKLPVEEVENVPAGASLGPLIPFMTAGVDEALRTIDSPKYGEANPVEQAIELARTLLGQE